MIKFMNGNDEYEEMLNKYTLKDGIKALVLFACTMVLITLVGLSYLSNLSAGILTSFQILDSIVEILICFVFVWLSKESLKTIGLTAKNLIKSLVLGIIGTIILTLVIIIAGLLKGSIHINNLMSEPSIIVISTFVICAIGEEIIFRGYIQTRILGMIKNRPSGIIVSSFLFLIIHYPVKWIVMGSISLTVIPAFYVICLLLLHFLCDYVYKKTNCLWGAVVLHFMYNIFQAMLVFH